MAPSVLVTPAAKVTNKARWSVHVENTRSTKYSEHERGGRQRTCFSSGESPVLHSAQMFSDDVVISVLVFPAGEADQSKS